MWSGTEAWAAIWLFQLDKDSIIAGLSVSKTYLTRQIFDCL